MWTEEQKDHSDWNNGDRCCEEHKRWRRGGYGKFCFMISSMLMSRGVGGVVRGQSCAENDHDQGQKVFHTGTTIFLLHQSKALDEAFQNGNGILVEAVVEAWGQF